MVYTSDRHTTEVVALVRGVAELPCDVTTPDPDDPVRLVLWYRFDSATPIYRKLGTKYEENVKTKKVY
ncbi:hypothetical protein OUZ56_013939 [Daphnia magna]|uniref:Uncharacterized protein n=1 Tax=Daphnia magna TaxID=35525 RepID=A0ABQ9Z7D3_9CRUS|nr:hypothetical protein OUZ56_013939 [Daphnia magna]